MNFNNSILFLCGICLFSSRTRNFSREAFLGLEKFCGRPHALLITASWDKDAYMKRRTLLAWTTSALADSDMLVGCIVAIAHSQGRWNSVF